MKLLCLYVVLVMLFAAAPTFAEPSSVKNRLVASGQAGSLAEAGPGSHSITIKPFASPYNASTAYFRTEDLISCCKAATSTSVALSGDPVTYTISVHNDAVVAISTTVPLGTDVINSAIISGDGNMVTRTATLSVGHQVFLPIVMRASAKRPGHVFLADGATSADYLYRGFVQTPFGLVWGPDGYLYMADWTGRHVVRVATDGTMDDLGIWRNPGMWQHDGPKGLAFDSSGNLYVNDHGHIYAVGEGGTVVELAQIDRVGQIAFSPADELYYTDRLEGKVLKTTPTGGGSEIVATGIENAENLVFGLDGALYVSQMALNRVVKVDTSTGQVSEFFSGPLGSDPIYLTTDSEGDIWIRGKKHLYQIAPDGTEKPFEIDGSTYSGPVSDLPLRTAGGIAFDDEGRLWIASYNSSLMRLDPSGPSSDSFTFTLLHPGFQASDLATGPAGEVYAYNENSKELWRIGLGGDVQVIRQFECGGRVALATDVRGELFLGLPTGEISRLDAEGNLSHYAWLVTLRMMFAADGYLYAAVGGHDDPKSIVRITDVDTYTTLVTEIDGDPLGPEQVHVGSAPEGGLYIFDESSRKVYHVDFAGQARLIANLSSLSGGPWVMAVSRLGDIFLVPHGPYDVYRLDENGNPETFAIDVYGDPWGMVVSPDDRWLYVAESGAIDKIPIHDGIRIMSTVSDRTASPDGRLY